ncbi:hypothetical protein LCGC14_1368760 [marine sediment metagenome]|uniref:Uncharacterized protein n=1 Tax=marine sediment metagenome TaxID=412755 RepID=A0A0F9N7Y4_9ZZZZ
MNDDTTKPPSQDSTVLTADTNCTCGGCGTGTTCIADYTGIKLNAQGSVYAYAAPGVLPDGTGGPTWPWPPTETTDTTVTPDDKKLRSTLQDEIIKDLLERVQRLETIAEKLKEQNLDLRGSLDALVDIMDKDEPEQQSISWDDIISHVTSTVEDKNVGNIIAVINRILNTVHDEK